MSRKNTKLIQAHIPEELKTAFDIKLAQTGQTMQDVLSEFAENWTRDSKKILERLQEIRKLSYDALSEEENDVSKITDAVDLLILDIAYGKIK